MPLGLQHCEENGMDTLTGSIVLLFADDLIDPLEECSED